MAKKKRPFTPSERLEVERLSRDGIRGQLTNPDRCEQLHKINPEEYGKINSRARKEVQDAIRSGGIG